MPARHKSAIAKAELHNAEGRAREAAVAYGQAARWAPHRAAEIEDLSAMVSAAELALHQAIWEAHEDGASWRMLGHYTNLSWQALHRRYRTPPARRRPVPADEAWRKEREERRRGRKPAALSRPRRRRSRSPSAGS